MITIRKLSDSQAEEIQIELKQDFPWKEYPQAKGNYPLALCLKSDDVAEEKRGIRLDFPSETAFRMFRDLLYPLYSIYIFKFICPFIHTCSFHSKICSKIIHKKTSNNIIFKIR